MPRHAYGDVYKNTEMYIDGPGDADLLFTGLRTESERKELIHHFDGAGVLQGMHNLDASIDKLCKNAALIMHWIQSRDLWFARQGYDLQDL